MIQPVGMKRAVIACTDREYHTTTVSEIWFDPKEENAVKKIVGGSEHVEIKVMD